jgi:hypothetical protein
MQFKKVKEMETLYKFSDWTEGKNVGVGRTLFVFSPGNGLTTLHHAFEADPRFIVVILNNKNV